MQAIWFAVASLALGNGPLTEVLREDFRAGELPRGNVKYFGAGSKQYVHSTPDGLRITLPGKEQPIGMVGVTVNKPGVPGDFDVTIGYEVLTADTPKGGYGLGLSLAVVAETQANDNASIAFRSTTDGKELYGTDRGYYTPDKKDKHSLARFPAAPKRGKLRLARVGTILYYSVAGEGDAEFRELRQAPFVAAPLRSIRVTADTGNGLGEFDARVTDLVLRTPGDGKAAAVAAAPNPADEAPAAPAGRKWWLIAAVLVAGFLLVLGALAAWLVLRRPEAAPPPPAPTPRPKPKGK